MNVRPFDSMSDSWQSFSLEKIDREYGDYREINKIISNSGNIIEHMTDESQENEKNPQRVSEVVIKSGMDLSNVRTSNSSSEVEIQDAADETADAADETADAADETADAADETADAADETADAADETADAADETADAADETADAADETADAADETADAADETADAADAADETADAADESEDSEEEDEGISTINKIIIVVFILILVLGLAYIYKSKTQSGGSKIQLKKLFLSFISPKVPIQSETTIDSLKSVPSISISKSSISTLPSLNLTNSSSSGTLSSLIKDSNSEKINYVFEHLRKGSKMAN